MWASVLLVIAEWVIALGLIAGACEWLNQRSK